MRKIFLMLFLISISMVFAAQADVTNSQGNADLVVNSTMKIQANNEVQNQVREMNGENGSGMVGAKLTSKFKLQSGNSEVTSSLELSSDSNGNRTTFNAKLSNGKNAEIKVMPNTASETAMQRLQLKNCNSSNNCSIELKETGSGNETRLTYEVRAQKEVKLLGLFKTNMSVEANIDADNGEVVSSRTSWWSFLSVK